MDSDWGATYTSISMSLEQGYGVMVSLATVVAALFIGIGLEYLPINGRSMLNGKIILIYSGSFSFGGLAVQYAADVGYEIVTTLSPCNWRLL